MGIQSWRRRVVGVATAVAMGAVLLAAGAPGASAAGPIPVECDTGGTVVATDGAPDTWSVHLEGVCGGGLNGLTMTRVVATGSSQGLGLCDASLVVQDLLLDVTVTERHVVTGRTVTTQQTWSLPISAYPIATPFLIGGEATGAGVFATRLFLRCGETGSANARAIFAFSS